MIKFTYKRFRFYSYPFLGIIMYLLFALINPFDEFFREYSKYKPIDYLIEIAYLLFFTAITVESGILVTRLLNKHLPWEKSPRYRFMMQLFIQISFLTIVFFVLFNFSDVIYFSKIQTINNLIIRQSIVIGALVSLLNTAVFTAQYFFNKLAEARVEGLQLQQLVTQSQLDVLKSHINPHFLFNNFSILASLIEEDKGQAIKYLSVLSSVYRYVLQSSAHNTIALSEELSFINLYFSLYQVRYQTAITLSVDVPIEKKSKKVCPMTLQLLIENAVKHNTITIEAPLQISITERAGWLIISNNMMPKLYPGDGTGLGLLNIIKRYSLLTDAIPVFSKTDMTFTVKIPLI
jgi:sensor histidine kinase YesM